MLDPMVSRHKNTKSCQNILCAPIFVALVAISAMVNMIVRGRCGWEPYVL